MPRTTKPAKKTTAQSAAPRKVPQAHGGALNAGGTPGNKGGTGRPPLAFKDFLARLRSDPDVQQQLENALKDRESRAYGAALKTLIDYDPDKPGTKLEHTGKDGGPIEMNHAEREDALVGLMSVALTRQQRDTPVS